MVENIDVKVINKSKNDLPFYATPQAAGVDVYVDTIAAVVLKPLERKLFPTGLYMQLPVGYEAQMRPRSGMALKKGVTVLNTPGTIDSDYRGEVGVILVNLSNEEVVIEPRERVAQIVFAKHAKANFIEVESLDETERGEGGFGHTGVK